MNRPPPQVDDVRRFALSLPEAIEQPHFDHASFRVRGKIFVTIPPDGRHVHVFLDEEQRATALALHPDCGEKLWWGSKVTGLRVSLAGAGRDVVEKLVRQSWARKAPKSLARE